MRHSLIALLLLAASPALAQIQVKERFELGEPIIASVPADVLKDSPLDWRAKQVVALPNGIEVLALAEASCIPVEDGRIAHLWAVGGKYWIELSVVDGRTIKRYHATFIVGTAPPPTPPGPGPGPGPTPPTPTPPTPTPDDPWGVASTVSAVANALSQNVKAQCSATAALFNQAADKLETGGFASIGQAAQWLQTERKKLWGASSAEWAPVEEAFGQIWNSHWPMTKAQVIDFYRSVAKGLGAVSG